MRIVLITGAASGIGKATAHAFANKGDTVVLADAAEEAGKEVEREIVAKGGSALFLRCDVTVEAGLFASICLKLL